MNKRISVLSLGILGVLAAGAPFAVAQDSGVLQEVVVTGSRIPTDPNIVASTPVQFLDATDLRLSGEINLAEIVNDIPALVASTTAENSPSGANALNLRGMGSARTLTLVNGRRHVAGFRGTQAVDVGSIPRALVERVEVTTGGASAVYGSDAVTGVVNLWLRDDFEGISMDARGGVSGQGDAENFYVDVLFGDNFAEGRGNLVLAVSVEEDSSITHGDRSWSRNNGIAVTQTNPDFLTNPNAPPRAVINDARFWLTSQAGSIAPGGFTTSSRTRNYGVDVNNNGIIDCQESQAGRTSFLAGCWITNPDGSVSVFKDGLVLNGLWSIGGMGGAWVLRPRYPLPGDGPGLGQLQLELRTERQHQTLLRGQVRQRQVEPVRRAGHLLGHAGHLSRQPVRPDAASARREPAGFPAADQGPARHQR